jgi:hypothetical protein
MEKMVNAQVQTNQSNSTWTQSRPVGEVTVPITRV